MASKRESQRHKRLKLISENLFAHMGYSVKREKYEEGEILSYKGKQPDLLLDGEIPVEVGNTSKEKINHYLREGTNEVYWIPFPKGNGVESMEIIKLQTGNDTIREELKRKIKGLRTTIKEKEEKIQELEEKLQQYVTLFRGATIRVYPKEEQISPKHVSLPTKNGKKTEGLPDQFKPRDNEGKKEYAHRLYNTLPKITQKEVANLVARYHPDCKDAPAQNTISRWISLAEEWMSR